MILMMPMIGTCLHGCPWKTLPLGRRLAPVMFGLILEYESVREVEYNSLAAHTTQGLDVQCLSWSCRQSSLACLAHGVGVVCSA